MRGRREEGGGSLMLGSLNLVSLLSCHVQWNGFCGPFLFQLWFLLRPVPFCYYLLVGRSAGRGCHPTAEDNSGREKVHGMFFSKRAFYFIL